MRLAAAAHALSLRPSRRPRSHPPRHPLRHTRASELPQLVRAREAAAAALGVLGASGSAVPPAAGEAWLAAAFEARKEAAAVEDDAAGYASQVGRPPRPPP